MLRRRTSALAVLISVCALLIVTSAIVGAEKKSIKWRFDPYKAAEEARVSAKPMIMNFYTAWCGWCKKLDRETFSDPRVVDLSVRFVMAKVDGEKYAELTRRAGIEGYPTILFLNSKGKEIGRVVGYQDADEFLKSMHKALKNAK